jgi:hypothetical protein
MNFCIFLLFGGNEQRVTQPTVKRAGLLRVASYFRGSQALPAAGTRYFTIIGLSFRSAAIVCRSKFK